jgi:gamma-glutamylaminecyclotransferase
MIDPAIRSKAMKVFVYGTLQRGRHNHHILRNARFIGKAVTVRKFGMTDVGFPFMLPWQAIAPVAGELFDIGDDADVLAALDRLESEGRMYDRVQGMVEVDGQRHLASFYVKCPTGRSAGKEVPVNARGLLEWRAAS